MSQISKSSANVRVCCRFRPLNTIERERGSTNVCSIQDGTSVMIKTFQKPFTFDRVFDPDTSQSEVFQYVGEPLVKEVMTGFNTTIFAYGQTGSGKTFSMLGDPRERKEKGIIPRLVDSIFQAIESSDASMEFTVKLSYVEIYLEKIRDLLSPDKTNLKIREHSSRGVWIQDVTESYVGDYENVLEIMIEGQHNRAMAATNMNFESSRSHSVFLLTLGQTNKETGSKKSSKLILVDLAGSESVGKSGAEGQTLTEAKHINRSLSALGNVINALTSGGCHIPYRDSKLTRLLSDSLGGNSKTCLLITCSPSSCNTDETLSTLRFGSRAKNIQNKPKVNQEKSVAEYKKLLNEAYRNIKALEKTIASLKSNQKSLIECLKQNNILIPDMNISKRLNDETAGKMQKPSSSSETKNKSGIIGPSDNLKSELQEQLRNLEKDANDFSEQLEEKKKEIQKIKAQQIECEKQRDEAIKKNEENCITIQQMKTKLEEKITLNKLLEKKMEGMEKERKITMTQLLKRKKTMEQRLQVGELMLKQERKKKRRAQKERDLVINQLNANKIDVKMNEEDSESSDDDDDDEKEKQDQLLEEILAQKKNSFLNDGSKKTNYGTLLKALQTKCDQYLDLQISHQNTKEDFQMYKGKMEEKMRKRNLDETDAEKEIKDLKDKLVAAEYVCARMIESGLYWRRERRRAKLVQRKVVIPIRGGKRNKRSPKAQQRSQNHNGNSQSQRLQGKVVIPVQRRH